MSRSRLRQLLVETLEHLDIGWMTVNSAEELDELLLYIRSIADEACLEVASRSIRALDRNLAELEFPCSRCGKEMTKNRSQDRSWETVLGPLELWRTYLECRDCKVRFYPQDARLKLPRAGRMSPHWANGVSHAGAELPYEVASRLVKHLTGRDVAAKTIDDQVQRDGATLHQIECEEADRLWPYDAGGYPRTVDPDTVQSVRASSVAGPRPVGKVLVMQADGAMINLAADPEVKKERASTKKKRRKKGGNEISPEEEGQPSTGSPFRESIQILMYRLDDVVRQRRGKYGKRKKNRGQYRRERTMITHKQTIAVVNNPPLVAKQVNRAAKLWNHEQYEVRIFLADGASKLWDVAQDYFNFTVGILDINHARSHIHDCAKALCPREALRAKEWGSEWSRRILKEGAMPLLAHLQKIQGERWCEEGTKKLSNLIEYVAKHVVHMEYPDFVAKGYPIASGAVEGTNKRVLISRCRRAGQQFRRDNAQHLLALRCALADDRFDHAMTRVRAQQSYRAMDPPPQVAVIPRTTGPPTPCRISGERIPVPEDPPKRPTETTSRNDPDLEKLIPLRKRSRLEREGMSHLLQGGAAPRVANGLP